MLAEVRCRFIVQTLVAIDLFRCAAGMSHVYNISNRSYRAKAFLFEARLRDRQKLFAVWQNVELFSMPV